MITEPGIYEMTSEQYHADPCQTPSLSAGMINDILLAPAKCWQNSRRLNPEYEDDKEGAERFTIGSVAHVLYLEPEKFDAKVIVIDAPDWRSKAAKETRDDARASGMTAILAHHMEKVQAARRAFQGNHFTNAAFQHGKTEQSMFWLHPTYKFWCRARPDFIANAGTHLNDFKATANANPEEFGRHAYGLGYHRRAAWYLEGFEAVTGKQPDHYWFCNQEVKAPYLSSIVELDMSALEAGRVENDRAAKLFIRCLERNDWYGYRHKDQPDKDLAFQVGLPAYAYMQIDGRD